MNQPEKRYVAVGRGLIGSMLEELPCFDVYSHREYDRQNFSNYAGVVCTGALTSQQGIDERRWEDVFDANVFFPLRLMRIAKLYDIPFVAFSSAAVYRAHEILSEDDHLEAHNVYSASKISMEATLRTSDYAKIFIFRIPYVVGFSSHPSDFGERTATWKVCADVAGSIVYKPLLTDVILRALRMAGKPGIYNISSGCIHFPDFLESRFNWRGDIVPVDAFPMRPPNQIMNCDKAVSAGLIDKNDLR